MVDIFHTARAALNEGGKSFPSDRICLLINLTQNTGENLPSFTHYTYCVKGLIFPIIFQPILPQWLFWWWTLASKGLEEILYSVSTDIGLYFLTLEGRRGFYPFWTQELESNLLPLWTKTSFQSYRNTSFAIILC